MSGWRRALPVVLIGGLVAGLLSACAAPAAAPSPTAAMTATRAPSATPPPTATDTPLPTVTPTLTRTPLPTATWTPRPIATKTATPDRYAGVILSLADLPAGFAPLEAGDLTRLNLTEADLDRKLGYAGTGTRLHNLAAFANIDPKHLQVVVAFFYYPLSDLALNALEADFNDPQRVMAALTAAGQGAAVTTTVKLLAGMDKFGNKSMGVTLLQAQPGAMTMRTDYVLARRTRIVEYYYSSYVNNTHPLVGVGTLAKLLDGRIAAAQAR